MRYLTRLGRGRAVSPVQISEKDGVRLMHLGGPAVQSAMRIRAPFELELEYTRAMMAFELFHPAARDVALIGLGGGSIAKFIHLHLRSVRLTALEVNPDVVAAARAYFSLPADDERLTVRVGDGAAYVREQREALDVLMVDGYDAERIVEDLASAAFYGACFTALRPGGVAVFNLWGSDRRFETYHRRLEDAFAGRMLLLPAEQKGNVVVFCFRPPLPDLGFALLRGRAERCQRDLGLEFPRFLDRLRSCNPCTESGFALAWP
jgi:spermidine synthase